MVPSDQINKIKNIIRYVKLLINKDFDECLSLALEEYHKTYYNSIILILQNNPPNSLNKDGTKFWSGNKRCPNPLPFNIENKLIFLFIKKYATILANSMSIPIINDDEYIKNKLCKINSNFLASKNRDINNEMNNKNYDYCKNKNLNLDLDISPEQELVLRNQKINKIKERINLSNRQLTKIKEEANNLNISDIKKNINNIFINQEFEKDDDKNGHIDFIYAASNLRAEIFKIEKCNKIKTKIIAGKIIPAIATTTAAIVGLVSIQLYTLYQTSDIKFLRDNYFMLYKNKFEFHNPLKYKEIQTEEKKNVSKQNKIFNFMNKINLKNIFFKIWPKLSGNI